MNRGLAKSGATIVFEPIPFMLLLMPVSLGRAETVDEQPGENIGCLVRARAYLLVVQPPHMRQCLRRAYPETSRTWVNRVEKKVHSRSSGQ